MNLLLTGVPPTGYVESGPGETPRGPESFPFASGLTSILEYLGEDVGHETVRARGRSWTQRFVNKELLAASGMAFGLLWDGESFFSALDLAQVDYYDRLIRRAFAWAGYGCRILSGGASLAPIAESLRGGIPLLAFFPECMLVCGYHGGRDALIGWHPFGAGERMENGMTLLPGWRPRLRKIVLPGGKASPRRDLRDTLEWGLSLLGREAAGRYPAGQAAYRRWAGFLLDPSWDTLSEEELARRHRYHHLLVGSLAEARCYLGDFLRKNAGQDPLLEEAARQFHAVHRACWKTWAVLDGPDARADLGLLRVGAKRRELAFRIRFLAAGDRAGGAALARWLAAGGAAHPR